MPPPPNSEIPALRSHEAKLAAIAAVSIATHLLLRFIFDVAQPVALLPLYATLALGGIPMLVSLARNLLQGEFGSDILAVLRDFPEPVKPESISLHATIAGTGGSK